MATTETGDDGKTRKRRNIVTVGTDFQIDESDYNVVYPIFQQFVKDNDDSMEDGTTPEDIDIRRMINVSQSDPERRVNALEIPRSVQTPPKTILRLDALEELKMDVSSETPAFPRWLTELPMIRKLEMDLRRTSCYEGGYVPFPSAVCTNAGFVMNLRELELSIDHIPEEIEALSHLEVLIARNGTISLPRSIGNLKNLERLILCQCENLQLLPDEIGGLTSLKLLDLTDCENLQLLPDDIGNLTSLETFDLTRCMSIDCLPRSIGNLVNLKHLDLTSTLKLKELPEEIENLTSLMRLDLSGCGVARKLNPGCSGLLPNSISNLKNLRYLDLKKLDVLHSLPDSFGDLTNLENLDLSNTGIASLPSSFRNLTNLRRLYLKPTPKMDVLPDEIENLTNLEVLCFDGPISNFTNFKNLRILHLDLDFLEDDSSQEALSKLVRQNPRLGCLGYVYDQRERSKILGESVPPNEKSPTEKHRSRSFAHTLHRTRARSRLFGAPNGNGHEISSPRLALWPTILEKARYAFDGYPECELPCFGTFASELSQSDAIFELLVDHGATIVEISRLCNDDSRKRI